MANWYVNPEATGDGDGTSEANGYTTLASAEAAKNADITGTESVVFLCSTIGSGGTTSDTTAATINGWTTDATHTITVKSKHTEDAGTSRRHDGLYGNANGAYKLEVTDANALANIEQYVTIEGLQIKVIYAATTNKSAIAMWAVDAGSDTYIKKNIIVIDDANETCHGIKLSDTDLVCTITNNLIYAIADKPDYLIYFNDVGTADVYNNTLVGPADIAGIQWDSGTVTLGNNIVCQTDADFTGTFSGTYNASDDQDGPGVDIGPLGADWDNEFTNDAGFDFTVKDTNANIYLGSPITQDDDANVPDDDIIYNSRETGAGESVCVGCFEYQVAASGTVVPIMIHHYKMVGGL